MRLISAVALAVIILPGVLRIFLAFSPEDTAQTLLQKLVSAIPFGYPLLRVVSGVLTEVMSDGGSLLTWLQSQNISFPHYLSQEMGKMVFSGAILSLMTSILSAGIADKSQRGTLNRLADIVFVTVFVFLSGLAADLLFGFVDGVVKKSAEIFREIYVYISSCLLGAGGVALLMLTRLVFLDVLLKVLLSCLKMLCTYGGIIWVLICSWKDFPDIWGLAGIALWFTSILLVQWGEDLILK